VQAKADSTVCPNSAGPVSVDSLLSSKEEEEVLSCVQASIRFTTWKTICEMEMQCRKAKTRWACQGVEVASGRGLAFNYDASPCPFALLSSAARTASLNDSTCDWCSGHAEP
jgi:hypothetical protein